MAYDDSCHECGETNWRYEGDYAMLRVVNGKLQFNVETMATDALVVRAQACGNCGNLKLTNVP